MDIPNFSDILLRKFHNFVKDSLAEDDAIPAGQNERFREERGLRKFVNELEAEMDKRGLVYTKIKW